MTVNKKKRLCYNCHKPGHESNDCPDPKQNTAKQCYSCGDVGHIQTECPNQAQGAKCYNCGQFGHISKTVIPLLPPLTMLQASRDLLVELLVLLVTSVVVQTILLETVKLTLLNVTLVVRLVTFPKIVTLLLVVPTFLLKHVTTVESLAISQRNVLLE